MARALHLQFIKDVLDYLPYWGLAWQVIWNMKQWEIHVSKGNSAVLTLQRTNSLVLLLDAGNGWWLHEASPCGCWKIMCQTDDTARREMEIQSTQWLTKITWSWSFLFLFPRALEPEMLFRIICQGSRRHTVESSSFFCSSSFNNLALRLFPFPDISVLHSRGRRAVYHCKGEDGGWQCTCL
jgi:hypothetical protein